MNVTVAILRAGWILDLIGLAMSCAFIYFGADVETRSIGFWAAVGSLFTFLILIVATRLYYKATNMEEK